MLPSSVRALGRAADATLALTIVLAPVAGGSSHLAMLPVLAVLAGLSASFAVLGTHGKRRELSVPYLVIGLVVLGLLTAAQLVPLPRGLLELLSPRAVSLRNLVGDTDGARPLSYEPAATAREASKLLILALVALAAAERTRANGRFRLVGAMVVVAGLASAAVALIHRAVGAQRMLGVIPSLRAPQDLITTFVNPNHAAAFMTLGAMTGLGLALSVKDPRGRVGWFSAALLLTTVSVLGLSRGGLVALLIGLVGVGLAWYRLRGAHDGSGSASRVPPVLVVAAAVVATAVVLWRLDEFTRQFSMNAVDPLSLAGKLAAMRDAWPMILEHKWTGIGRGSYISVYAGYKTWQQQFTFSHPENLVFEALSDWGLLLGSIALIAFAYALMVRYWQARSLAAACAMAGVIAVSAQNLVDFSLEILGVSVSIAAILGGAGLGVCSTLKLPEAWGPRILVILFPLAFLGAAAFELGDLDEDHQRLRSMIVGSEPRLSEAELIHFSQRHPANAAIAAKLSYLAETHEPRDREHLGDALRWANRALLLDTHYADAHLASGRILITAGFRDQGFSALRRAWALGAGSERQDQYLEEILRLAETPAELARAIPRASDGADTFDGKRLAELLSRLAKRGENERGMALVNEIAMRLRELPPEDLLSIADSCRRLGGEQTAIALLRRRERSIPGDVRATTLLVDLEIKRGDLDAAEETLERGLAAAPVDTSPFLRRRFDLALRRTDLDAARQALEQLRSSMAPTDQNRLSTFQLEAKLELLAGRPGGAMSALNSAINLAPASAGLRLERARVALRLGRPNDAKTDLEEVLRSDPANGEASRMVAEVERALQRRPHEGSPPSEP